eukprot:TRINITY_DN2780_c0_g1_i2.p2 TRINITY_DN2780_c0_g1~~TRINITY_DN2780_c0_g1_i2.p2  ORF type:complete len:191 (+),score=46.91 TRINITY_DN2780_c0_g1_i2:327-899(+)
MARLGLTAELVLQPICSEARDTSPIDTSLPLGQRRGGSAPHTSVMSKDAGERCGGLTLADEPYHQQHLLQQSTSPPSRSQLSPWVSRAGNVLPCLCLPLSRTKISSDQPLDPSCERTVSSEPDDSSPADPSHHDASCTLHEANAGHVSAHADETLVLTPSLGNLRSMLRRSVFAQTLQSRYNTIVNGSAT